MSWQALDAVDVVLADDRYGFGPAHSAVLQAIAYRVNHETGVTYTGGALERRSRCSRATVWRVLADLEYAGVVVVTRRKGRASVVALSTAYAQPVASRDTLRVSDLSRDATHLSRDATPPVASRDAYMDLYTDQYKAAPPVDEPKLTRADRERILSEARRQTG